MPSAVSSHPKSAGASGATTTNAHSTRTIQDQDLLKQLDASCDRICAVVSDEPYVLTIPQDEPKYHHYSRYSADAWLQDTPFHHSENYQIQYQTFFYREPYSDLFERVRASHFDRPMSQIPANSTPRSVTTTPSLGPKKKISLDTYNKNKKAQGAGTSSARSDKPQHTPAPLLKETVRKQEKDSQPRDEVKVKKEKVSDAKSHIPDSHLGILKRKPLHSSTDSSNAHLRKKPRLSPSPLPSASRTARSGEDVKRPLERPSPLGALSPLGRLSPLSSLYLPGRLSPTLPPNVVAALDQGHHKRSTSDSSVESTDSNTQPKTRLARPGSKHDSVLSHSIEAASEDTNADSSQKPSVAQSFKKDNIPEEKHVPEPSTKDRVSKPSHSDTQTSQKGPDHVVSAETPSSLVYVFKIPKTLRIAARRLTQFPSQPWKGMKPEEVATRSPELSRPTGSTGKKTVKSSSEKRVPKVEEEPLKGVARKTSVSSRKEEKVQLSVPKLEPPPTATSPAKRLRPEDDSPSEPLAKRKKILPTVKIEKDPSTPIQPAFRSPALPNSTVKSQQLTPSVRKDLRTSVAMKRTESSDSFTNMTPTIINRTPAPSSQANAGAERPQNTPSNTKPSPSSRPTQTPESRAWNAEYTRLSSIARELKHASPSSRSQKVAEATALIHLESFLAFVLAFYCFDNSYTCASDPPPFASANNWKSCSGFWDVVSRQCRPFPHLHGLSLYLGAVFKGVIMRRLTSSSNSKQLDPQTLHTTTSTALRAIDEAIVKLPLAAILAHYPETWKRGLSTPTTSASASATSSSDDTKTTRSAGPVTPKHYNGAFGLNIGIHTEPLEAVRFAYSVMGEWCANKHVEYKMTLKLSV